MATPWSSVGVDPPGRDLVGSRDDAPRGRLALSFAPSPRAIGDRSSGGGIEYQSCLEVEHVDLEIFRHLCEEIRLDGSPHRLFHSFPSSNRLAPAPISQVIVSSRVNDLSIQWFHTFPDECAIVRTQSLFEVKAPASKRWVIRGPRSKLRGWRVSAAVDPRSRRLADFRWKRRESRPA